MPRHARIVIPGYLYHITQRGNYKQNIFEEDQDWVIYLKLVQEYSKKYGVEMYAYCLMITTCTSSQSQNMKNLWRAHFVSPIKGTRTTFIKKEESEDIYGKNDFIPAYCMEAI